MTEQLPPIDIGSPVSANAPATEDESYFDKYVDDKSKKPPSFIDRAYDTARASYYKDTIFGIGEAKEQSNFSTLYPEQYPDRFGYDLKLIEAAKDSTAANAPMTQAQLAEIKNKSYPEAQTAGEKTADILGGLVGGSASPETFALPAVKGLTALKATSALGSSVAFAEKYLPGMAYRAVDTGLGQAALMATVNPVIQNGRISAGLQREFDPWEMTLAPLEGFVVGAGLHVGFEVAGKAAGKAAQAFADSPTGKSMMEGFERRIAEKAMTRIKEVDAGFRAPTDIIETPREMGANLFDARTEAGQPATDVVGTVEAIPTQASLPATVDSAAKPNRLNAADMLSDTQGALNGGSIDAMRFASAPRTEDIDALIEVGQKREDAEIDRIFGEDAEKVKGLIRRGRIDQVDDIIYDKFGSYDTPEAKEVNGIIYGMDSYSIVNTESLKSLRDRLSNLEFAVQDAANGDASQLSKELAWVAPELPDISAPESSHTETQRIAILSLARAIEDMNALNIDPLPILRETVNYTGLRVGGDVSDAGVLLDRLAQYANEFLVKAESERRPKAAMSAAKAIDSIPVSDRSAKIPALTPETNAMTAPATEGGPAGIFMLDPTEMKVDAKRFQFKEGGDEQGVTSRLKSVTKWDQAKGNQVIAWQDLNGELYVVDGHQRTGLAKRLIEQGNETDIKLPGLLYREADGISAEDVRAIAAVKNIAEGSGSALDGAKVLRSRPDLMDGSLPLSEGKSRQAYALSRLSDEPFRMVVNDVVPENYGAIVGERIPNDPARQEAAIKALARFEPRNETEASVLVQRVAQAELEKAQEGAQGSMFADLETADSTAGEEMRIVSKAIQELKKDKTLFQRVVANVERIEQTGSSIEREAAKEVTNEAELFAKRLASDAYSAGPLRDELKAAAKDFKNGKISLNDATARIRSALRGAAETDGGAGIGNRAGDAQELGSVQFRTSKGSTYEVYKDGTTTRNKAKRNDVGHEGDFGLKERSARTIYVDSEADAVNLSAAGLSNIPEGGMKVILRDGKASLVWKNKSGKLGSSKSSRNISFSDTPEIGKHPVELWNPTDLNGEIAYGGQHAGNKIVEIARRDGLASEKTAAGDQTLVPGVRAVTEADKIALEAGRPLTGGNEPAGGMFDEANTNQTDMFGAPKLAGEDTPDLQFRTRGPSYPPEEASRIAEARNGEVLSLQQQSLDLADMLGIPVREGRVQGGRYVQGQYERKFGVARVSQIGDFYTVAHEAGHAIEQRIGGDLQTLMNKHAAELAKLDPSGEGSVSEGFAEWMVKFILNPASAMKDAPNFTPVFTDFLGQRDPSIMNALAQASNNYAAFISAPTPVQLGASITGVEPQGWFRGLVRSYKENGLTATIGRVLADAYTSVLDAYDPLTRATRDLTRMVYEANNKQVVDMSAAERPDILMRMWFARSAQGAAYQLRYGVVPNRSTVPTGPSLHDAIAVAVGEPGLLGRWDNVKVDEFGLFLAIKRAEVLIERYNAGDFGERYPLPDNWTRANVESAKAAMLAENQQYEQAAQMVHDYTQQLLKKQFDGGIIDKELYDKLSETPFYVPMFRDVSDKPLSGVRPGASPDSPGLTDTIKTLRGSSRDIINPLQGIMQQTFLIERTLRHNDVIRAFVDLAARAGAPSGYMVEPVPASEVRALTFDVRSSIEKLAKDNGIPEYDAELLMSSINNVFGEDPLLGTMFKKMPTEKRGEPIVFYKEAGEMKAVRLMAGKEGMAIYEAMMTLPTAGKDVAAQVMQAAGNIQRAGIVFEPTFMISNLVRDQMAVGILRPDYIPFWDGARGVWSEITQDEAAQLYGYFGGQSAGGAVNESVGMAVGAGIDDLGRKNWLQQRTKNPLAFIEGTQISEAGTRNSIFAKAYEQKLSAGMSPYEAAMEAAWAGTDILDFSRHGSKTFIIRQLTPFWNANIQALDKARRTMLEPLARAAKGDVLTVQDKLEVANAYMAMFKFAAVGSALGAIWAAVNNEDEVYRDADPKRKGTHFVFSAGGKEYDIPKPFELSLGFTLGEQAFAALYNKDPRAASNFITAAWETFIPPMPIVENPLIKASYEGATGVDTYTGRDIVPENMQKFNETPHLQYNERTAPLAVGIGQTSKVIADYLNQATGEAFGKAKPFSPIKVEHMFGTAFGTTGRDMMAASHWFTPSDTSAPAQFEDTVFLRRYIKDPTRTSDTITKYYQHVAQKTGDYVSAVAAFDELIKKRRPTDAKELYNGLKADQKAYVLLASAGTDDGKSSFDAGQRRIHPMTRAQNALAQLGEVARQIGSNILSDSETGQTIQLSRPMRKAAIEAIHQLGAQEMRNALVMTNEPGYEGRNILDVNKQYAVIKAISPSLADEVARRYAMAGVYKTDLVAKNWPAARKELIRNGSEADISDISGGIADEGFEFGADKIKRPRKLRLPMEGQPAFQ
jgi:hypothetical protein